MAEQDIQRVNTYGDGRFSSKVLRQHGAFLVDGQPYEVEITGPQTAVVRGADRTLFPAVIELFRFYAGHICRFYDGEDSLIRGYPAVELFPVKLEDIQPSQFYVDEDKLAAVHSFIHGPENIVIPVIPEGIRYISADGHTRLRLAVEVGYQQVYAFLDEDSEYLHGFVEEARKRGVYTPHDLKKLSHEEYEIKWDQFCDDYFARRAEDDSQS